MPPPPPGGMSPYPPSPWSLPPGHPMMGPIPMGYQLAKDPMTGQILLIPTDPSQRPPQGNFLSSFFFKTLILFTEFMFKMALIYSANP